MNKLILFTELTINILFNFLATLMHEITHALVAILTMSKIYSISVVPKVEIMQDYIRIIYGSVVSAPRFKALQFFVALAPFLLFIPLFYILDTNHILEIYYKNGAFIFSFEIKNFLKLHILVQYFIVQLFLGAFPSSTDYRVAIRAIFSGGFVVSTIIIIGAFLWYLNT